MSCTSKILTVTVLGLSLALLACGGGSSSSTSGTVAIAITPTSATLPINTSQQFSATVTNASNTNVTWQVNGTTGGSATYGLISTAGLYTAPASVPASAITVTAIAVADTSKTATATITLSNTNQLSVSPAVSQVAAGGQQTFAAMLGSVQVDANWSLSCQTTVIGACGTITSSGVYTAPLSPPLGQTVSIIAASRNNTALSANATTSITFSNGTLIGNYGFLLTGKSGGNSFSEVGSITFDGKGNITGGSVDRSGSSAAEAITGGTYTSDAQGRVSATVQTASGSESWQITMVNHSRSVAIRSDSAVASGDLDLQDSSKFGQTLTGMFGIYLKGTSAASIPTAAIVGGVNLDTLGNVTTGLVDVNDGGAVSTQLTTSGALSASSATSGRGTFTLANSYGSSTFVYYLVDSNSAKMIEVDGAHDFAGRLTARVSSSSVTPSFFVGNFGFVFSGANSSGVLGHGGTFQVFAGGNISNGTLDVATSSAFGLGNLFTGSLNVTDPVTGRSTVSFNVNGSTLQFVTYAPNTSYNLTFLEIDGSNVTSGMAMRQGTVYVGTNPSVSGQYAMSIGEISTSVNRVGVGTVSLPTPSGTFDLNDGGVVTLGSTLQFTSFTTSSLYGRSQFQFQAGNYKPGFTAYIIDQNTVQLLETDGTGVVTGLIEKRY